MKEENIKKIIEDIFTKTGCKLDSVSFSNESGMYWCAIETPDSRFVIGRDGETLKSLNHLVRKMAERHITEEETNKLWIDVNGYQKKKFDGLKNLAHMMAERAKYFKSRVEIDPMPSSDRRMIHLFLENTPNIKTESEGSGPYRRVVIRYTEENLV